MADKVSRAKAYLDRLPVAVSGAGGHNATLRAACECYRFGLSDAEAWEALQWFNQFRCQPQWSEHELKHKLASAQTMTAKGGQTAKHLGGPSRNYGRAPRQFVAPPPPARRVQLAAPVVIVMPVWLVSAAEEERRWTRVASELGYTLEAFDAYCGIEALG